MRCAFALLAVAALACDDLNPPVIDSFPIPVDVARGPLRTGARTSIDDASFIALIDTLSPVSLVDTLELPAEAAPRPTRRRTDYTVLAACAGDDLTGCAPVPRARFRSAPVIDSHPCLDPKAQCRVGLVDADGAERTTPFRGILGGDLLSQTAVRVDLRDPSAPAAELYPDIAGTSADHCRGGEAVLATPLAGGATLLIEGGEVAFSGTRIPVDTCLGFDPATDASASGTDALLLLATGLGPSVLSETGYVRYRTGTERDPGVPDAPPYDLLPVGLLFTPAGAAEVRLATLPRLALVGRPAAGRGPCAERRASRLMRAAPTCPPTADCPCEGDKRSCKAAAHVALAPDDGIQVAVLPDGHPLLQALREELRPEQAELDGLLGLDALRGTRFAVDYPNQRLLVRCGDATGCALITAIDRPDRGPGVEQCPAL